MGCMEKMVAPYMSNYKGHSKDLFSTEYHYWPAGSKNLDCDHKTFQYFQLSFNLNKISDL